MLSLLIVSNPFKNLAQIRKKFGSIDVITWFNGLVVKGAIVAQGKMLKVVTVKKTILISKKDVQKIEAVP